MSMIRKFKREMLKKEIGSNKIKEEFHILYGLKPNKTKQEIKLAQRIMIKLRKLAHKKARLKRKGIA